jgi:hypothetical protein
MAKVKIHTDKTLLCATHDKGHTTGLAWQRALCCVSFARHTTKPFVVCILDIREKKRKKSCMPWVCDRHPTLQPPPPTTPRWLPEYGIQIRPPPRCPHSCRLHPLPPCTSGHRHTHRCRPRRGVRVVDLTTTVQGEGSSGMWRARSDERSSSHRRALTRRAPANDALFDIHLAPPHLTSRYSSLSVRGEHRSEGSGVKWGGPMAAGETRERGGGARLWGGREA